jgi:hypothetical protein
MNGKFPGNAFDLSGVEVMVKRFREKTTVESVKELKT